MSGSAEPGAAPDAEQPLSAGDSSHGEGAAVLTGAPPAADGEYQALVAPQHERGEPSCSGFCGTCFRPGEEVLGWARRWRGCGVLATPYYYGGWLLCLYNTAVVAAFMFLTPAREVPVLQEIAGVLYGLSVLLMMRLQCMDPGVLPRGEQPSDFPTTPCVTDSHVGTNVNGLMINQKDYVTLEGDALVVWRWCKTCEIHRPPRAAHCPVCNWCVREYDHHCPVVGGCIAQRTLSYFTWLLMSYAVQCVFIGVTTLTLAAQHVHAWRSGEEHQPVFYSLATIGVVIASGLSSCWSCGMGGMYVRMACTDRTMREEQRALPAAKRADGRASRGGCATFLFKMFSRAPPSQLK